MIDRKMIIKHLLNTHLVANYGFTLRFFSLCVVNSVIPLSIIRLLEQGSLTEGKAKYGWPP
jgi:hypothetical protein